MGPLDGPLAPAAVRMFEFVGERWNLRIVNEISHGSRRFDLLVDSTGISRNILSNRLKTLEKVGIVSRIQYSDRPPRFEYRLTDVGEELIPAALPLLRWGIRHYSDE